MDKERLHILFQRYMEQSATKEEERELMGFLADPANEEVIKDIAGSGWEEWQARHLLSEGQSQKLYNEITQRLTPRPQALPKRIIMRPWRHIAAAASVLILLGTGLYLAVNDFHHRNSREVATKTIAPDIAPPANVNAVLTLANGTKIVLDSTRNGVLAVQANVNISKLANGQITYHAVIAKNNEVLYNTITVPRGSKIVQLTLADGTKVWLNSASSIRYPTAFTEKERKVEITGEAYFEVTTNVAMPFIVMKEDAEIQVLGTHFNVNAYDDEPSLKVTLMEGSVKVVQLKTHRSQLINPGDQVQINKDGLITLVKHADMEQAVAWKSGLFQFDHADLQVVMRQVARWYDVDVRYEGMIPPRQFGGKISRNSNASEVLKVLELSQVHFSIEGRTIIVKP